MNGRVEDRPADRRGDGQRTFKLIEGERLATRCGGDDYRGAFAKDEEGGRESAIRLGIEPPDVPPGAGARRRWPSARR
jgi:hypothetical protein